MEICIWDKCNNKCVMCTNPEYPWVTRPGRKNDYSYEVLEARFEKLKRIIKENEPINLTGGETTLHPRFFDILDHLQNNFPSTKINLLTNGRMFAYEEFTKKTLAYPNLNIALPLHGYDEKSYDKLTMVKGSFKQVESGLKNLQKFKKPGQIVEARIIVTGVNFKYIDKTINYFKKYSVIDRFVVIFMEIEGQSLKNLNNIKIKYKDFKPYFKKFKKLINSADKEIRFYHFPLCAVPFDFWPYLWRTLPDYEIDFAKGCKNCSYKKYCLGVHKGYLENIGEDEFKPIDKKIKIIEGDNFQFYPIKKIIK